MSFDLFNTWVSLSRLYPTLINVRHGTLHLNITYSSALSLSPSSSQKRKQSVYSIVFKKRDKNKHFSDHNRAMRLLP